MVISCHAVDTDTPTEAATLSSAPTMMNCEVLTKKLIRVSSKSSKRYSWCSNYSFVYLEFDIFAVLIKKWKKIWHPYYATNEKATGITIISNDCLILSQPLMQRTNIH
jgi:hypothetical protein